MIISGQHACLSTNLLRPLFISFEKWKKHYARLSNLMRGRGVSGMTLSLALSLAVHRLDRALCRSELLAGHQAALHWDPKPPGGLGSLAIILK